MSVLMLIDSSCNRLLATLLLEMSELMQINSRAIAFFFPPHRFINVAPNPKWPKKEDEKKMLFTSLIIDYFNPDKSKVPQCWGIVADFCYHPVFSEWTAFLKVTFGRFLSHFLVIIYIVFFIYIMMKQCSHAWNKRHKHGAVTSWISESSGRIMQLIQDCPAIPQNWKKKTEFSCTTAILLIQNEF